VGTRHASNLGVPSPRAVLAYGQGGSRCATSSRTRGGRRPGNYPRDRRFAGMFTTAIAAAARPCAVGGRGRWQRCPQVERE
jgi:hypothetical protein